MKGIIFDIQFNCVYDGPGIRTCVFFKGCPLRCKWCHNPESYQLKPQMGYLAEKCTGCGSCAKVCPNGALKHVKKTLSRESEKCTVCGKCAEVCPNGATEVIGKEVSPEEIVEKVAADKIFYDNSGGGVTISGGEATLQPDFLIATLRAVKEKGIRTALETCGQFREELAVALIQNADLFLFDIKHVDSGLLRQFTGADLALVSANFERILASAGNDRVIVRIPVIPGFNADKDSISKIISYIKQSGYAGPVHLMPYNSLASTKWKKIGKQPPYGEIGELSEEALSEAINAFERAGFEVECNR